MKKLLLLHGEKILIAFVAIICIWSVYGTATDESTIPGKQNSKRDGLANKVNIDKWIDQVDKANARRAPAPKTPEDFSSAFETREKQLLSEPPKVVQYLTVHPDIGEVLTKGVKHYYIYQTTSPNLIVEDKTGSLTVSISAPEQKINMSNDDRLAGPLDKKEWTREDPVDGKIINKMEPCRIQLEIKEGDADWKSVPGGILNYTNSAEVDIPSVQGMVAYSFRARILYKGTGYLPSDVKNGTDVLVCDGMYNEANINWNKITKTPSLVPSAKSIDISAFGIRKSKNERGFSGAWTETSAVEAKSIYRIALKSVSIPSSGDAKPTARILLRKMLKGTESWTKPIEYKVTVGDEIGKLEEEVKVDGVPVFRSTLTGFVLSSCDKTKERVLHYELYSAKNKDGDKILEIKPNRKKTQTVILKHKVTGAEVELVQLKKWKTSPRYVTYPSFPNNKADEVAEFSKDDLSEYKGSKLDRPVPKKHKPTDPRLKQVDPLATNKCDYYSFADGRICYYNPAAKKICIAEIKKEEDNEDEDSKSEK